LKNISQCNFSFSFTDLSCKTVSVIAFIQNSLFYINL
jgi:hypothetical protein